MKNFYSALAQSDHLDEWERQLDKTGPGIWGQRLRNVTNTLNLNGKNVTFTAKSCSILMWLLINRRNTTKAIEWVFTKYQTFDLEVDTCHIENFNPNVNVTLLGLAIIKEDVKLVDLFVRHGARLDRECDGQTPLEFARDMKREYTCCRGVGMSSVINYLESHDPVVKRLKLMSSGAPRPEEKDMLEFLKEDSLFMTDFTVNINGTIIPCHMSVLKQRIPGLLAGKGEFKEDKERNIIIHDHTAEEVKWLIHSAYAGKGLPLPVEQEQAEDDDTKEPLMMRLCRIVDKYKVGFLMYDLQVDISKYIDVENVLSIFEMAGRYNADRLKEACLLFFAQHVTAVVAKLNEEDGAEVVHMLKAYKNISMTVIV